MKTFIAYQSPERPQNDDNIILLRDGISLLALIFPAFWLVYHRLWWALLVYGLVFALIALLGYSPFGAIGVLLSVIPGLYLFLEGDRLVQQKWERKGWFANDVVNARNLEEAEIRYFGNRIIKPDTPLQFNKTGNEATPIAHSAATIGLFPLDGSA